MAILLHLDELMAQKGYNVSQLADAVGISRVNMSHIRTGNIKAIRFSTLEKICYFLNCQPGDIIEYVREEAAPFIIDDDD